VTQCVVLTTNDFPGMRIVRVIGSVYGTSPRSLSALGNLVGNVRPLRGGRQKSYLKMIVESRDEALAQLVERAQSLGANAVLAMRFDSGEFGAGQWQTMNEVTAYGTAVVVEQA
jgi:uncharacterized protein YbjQ (UPF0145 family)